MLFFSPSIRSSRYEVPGMSILKKSPYALSEAAFQKQVIGLAHLHHWRVAHFCAAPTRKGTWSTPYQADAKGWPDLVLVKDRVIYAELKTDKGRLSDHQGEWLDRLSNAGQTVFVWRPTDLPTIAQILAA